MATRRNTSVDDERDYIHISNDIASSPAFFDFVLKVMSADVEVDTDALQESFDDECVRTRSVGYGNNKKELKYVPSKFIKDRLNSVLNCKYSFFILREERVTDPLPRYNRDEDSYVDSDCYIKVIGCLVIVGLGVQVAYGVKKTYGYGEPDDWKAAATDSFKKCCSMFGIEADYDIEDNVDDDSRRSSNKTVNLDDVEYDDDSLNEALETEITFGKFKNLTLDEIYEEDPSYIEWLVDNARDDDVRESSAIVLKYYEDQEASKKKSAKTKSSKRTTTRKKSSKTTTSRSTKSKTSSRSKSNDEDEEEEVDDERQALIENIEEIFEEDDYDDVTRKQLIQSVSTNKKNPKGKTKLSSLTDKELSALLEVLVEDEEYDDE